MGTLINVVAILLGSGLGLILKRKIPNRYIDLIFQALGIFTLYFGLKLALEGEEVLLMIISLITGGLLGEWARLEGRLDRLGSWLQEKVGRKSVGDKFSEGFAAAFLLFGIGPMATLGAIQEGLGEGMEVLLTKSLLDGISSVVLAAALGIGVPLSALPVALYQWPLTWFAGFLEPHISDASVTALTSVGGLILIGLGFNLLKINKLRVMNFLPALVIVVLLGHFW